MTFAREWKQYNFPNLDANLQLAEELRIYMILLTKEMTNLIRQILSKSD